MWELELAAGGLVMYFIVLPFLKLFTSPEYKEYKKHHPDHWW